MILAPVIGTSCLRQNADIGDMPGPGIDHQAVPAVSQAQHYQASSTPCAQHGQSLTVRAGPTKATRELSALSSKHGSVPPSERCCRVRQSFLGPVRLDAAQLPLSYSQPRYDGQCNGLILCKRNMSLLDSRLNCLYFTHASTAIVRSAYAGRSPTGHCLQVVNGPGSFGPVPVLVLCVGLVVLSLDPGRGCNALQPKLVLTGCPRWSGARPGRLQVCL